MKSTRVSLNLNELVVILQCLDTRLPRTSKLFKRLRAARESLVVKAKAAAEVIVKTQFMHCELRDTCRVSWCPHKGKHAYEGYMCDHKCPGTWNRIRNINGCVEVKR